MDTPTVEQEVVEGESSKADASRERQEAKTDCSNRTKFLLTLMGASEKNYLEEWQTVHFFTFSNETGYLSETMWPHTIY